MIFISDFTAKVNKNFKIHPFRQIVREIDLSFP